MEPQDEQVVTEEPQLRYWNPWRRSRSVFTTSTTPPASSVNSLHHTKLGSPLPVFCDSQPQSSVCDDYSSVSQELYQNTCEVSNLYSQQTANETISTGLSGFIPLETVSIVSSQFVVTHQEDGSSFLVKQEPEDDMEENIIHKIRDDIFTFNSIDEALDSIDSPIMPEANLTTISFNALQGNNNMGVSNEKHEEVVKAAKSLFSKRTRTLYHWLFPDTAKSKLKATVSAAWETLPEGEKHFYISQVLGRFGLQASSLMVNPQLGGMKCLPIEPEMKCDRKRSGPIEDQQAVDSLFDACEDAGSWVSYSEPKPLPAVKTKPLPAVKTKPLPADKPKPERKRRKYQTLPKETDKKKPDEDCVKKVIKRQRKVKKVPKDVIDFEEDPELTKELEKFRLITEAAEEDIWGDIPDPDKLFAEIAF